MQTQVSLGSRHPLTPPRPAPPRPPQPRPRLQPFGASPPAHSQLPSPRTAPYLSARQRRKKVNLQQLREIVKRSEAVTHLLERRFSHSPKRPTQQRLPCRGCSLLIRFGLPTPREEV